MSEILSFEEFVSKRNEARAVIKDYVIDCYIKKVKEKLLYSFYLDAVVEV